MACTLPLCHSNIRWTVSCRVGASDASLAHGGRAASLVSPTVANTLYRLAEHKGEHVRLDWEHSAVCPPSEMRQAPSELEQLIQDLPWNQTETCSFAHKQHINVLEAGMIHVVTSNTCLWTPALQLGVEQGSFLSKEFQSNPETSSRLVFDR